MSATQPAAEAEKNPLIGIVMKVCSVTLFVAMGTFIKLADGASIGQIVFFRSAFAMVPIFLYLAATAHLRTAFQTDNLRGHVKRGVVGSTAMALGFFGLTQLPLPDAIAIGYAMPLMTVVFGALLLGETVRMYRWSAVLVGLVGVIIISWPKLSVLTTPEGLSSGQALGALGSLSAAIIAAYVMIIVRRLVKTERTPTIVLYFSLNSAIMGLFMALLGWPAMELMTIVWLVGSGIVGGIAQILLTESYRYAETSVIAPFEYTSIITGIAVGYFVFADVPSGQTLLGAAIVVSAGIFIIFREHRLGLERAGSRRAVPPQG
jgi:drug/metabolite transporter (DMT)-like permease